MAKAAKKDAPASDHNSEREQWEEQQFLNGLRQIKDLESDMAGTKGEIGGTYKRLEAVGFDKSDIAWAKELEKKDAPKVIATMQRRIRIAKMLGHSVGRQFEMFEKDRAPATERAYDEGLAAGKMRKDAVNPYGADSKQGQEWQRGFNDGTAFINKDLASKFGNGDGQIISGDSDVFDDDESGDGDEAVQAAE